MSPRPVQHACTPLMFASVVAGKYRLQDAESASAVKVTQ
jgi:hypothetical protein